jgi:hypothetical protein
MNYWTLIAMAVVFVSGAVLGIAAFIAAVYLFFREGK